MEPAVVVDNVTKDFILRHNRNTGIKSRFLSLFYRNKKERKEKFTAVSNVSFTLSQGESLGLIGHNGSGKSTLLQVIAGIMLPTKGTITTRGLIAPLIQLGVGFNGELTGYQNIFLNASLFGFTNRQTLGLTKTIIEFSELGAFIDTPLKNYSSGMQMRLGFSIAVHINPHIMLADEILAVGDHDFQIRCLDKIEQLRRNGMALILVTHNTQQVKQFCDKYIRLDRGKIVASGSSSEL